MKGRFPEGLQNARSRTCAEFSPLLASSVTRAAHAATRRHGARHLEDALARWHLTPPLCPNERLAALTPRPRIDVLIYHRILAPRAALRERPSPVAGRTGA